MSLFTILSLGVQALMFLSLFLDFYRDQSFAIAQLILLRCICLNYFFAFLSLELQIEGLVGSYGLNPMKYTLSVIKENLSRKNVSKNALSNMLMQWTVDLFSEHTKLSGILKMAQAIALVGIVFPHYVIMASIYFIYSCFMRTCAPFLNLQWDCLVLEAGFLSILYSMANDMFSVTICNWLFKVLLFRLMFGSGLVKMFGRDPSWHTDYTAMTYHFLTQPLPSPIAPWAHALPKNILIGATVGTLLVEVLLPPLAMVPAFAPYIQLFYILLQLSISITGFYGFFNSLTMIIGISLLSDSVLMSMVYNVPVLMDYVKSIHLLPTTLASAVYCFVIVLCSLAVSVSNYAALEKLGDRIHSSHFFTSSTSSPTSVKKYIIFQTVTDVAQDCCSHISNFTSTVHKFIFPLYIGCHYGLFAHMTKKRDEIIIEISKNGKDNWMLVEFPFKPGSANLQMKMVYPPFHMPRVDWMLWFVALRPVTSAWPQWFWSLLIGILEQNETVLRLLDVSMIDKILGNVRGMDADNQLGSYKWVRVRLFRYTFADRSIDTTTTSHVNKNVNKKADENINDGNKENTKFDKYISNNDSKETDSSNQVYWLTTWVQDLLPASQVNDLYAYTDKEQMELARRKFNAENGVPKVPPTPEVAADIIKRTLFKGLRVKD